MSSLRRLAAPVTILLLAACGRADEGATSSGESSTSGGSSGTSTSGGSSGTSGSSETSTSGGSSGASTSSTSSSSGGEDGDGGSTTDAGPGTTDAGSTPGPGTPTAGCGKAPPQTGFVNGLGIQADGKNRTYALYVPPSYDKNRTYPLVFAFHGDGGTGSGIRSTMKLEAQANDAAIFVYPNGISQTWELDQPAATNKDIKLVVALVDQLGASFCTDASRRFATGFSRGAYFSNQLVCRSPRAFRAVASHGGGGPYGLNGEYDGSGTWKCTAPSPAALVVHGAQDGLGNFGAESRDWFRVANGCKATSTATPPSPCVAYDGCATGKPLVFCKVPNLGHGFWTSGAQATWSFFAAQ